MATKMTIPFLRDPVYLADDTIRVEIASVLQRDRVTPWPPDRARRGYGWTPSGSSGYGFGLSLSYGDGVYGGGFYGQCVEVKNHETQGLFVAGDYSVRLKAIDGLGNEGDWSDPFTIAHRPDPPAPTNPTVTSNVLAFDWSDP